MSNEESFKFYQTRPRSPLETETRDRLDPEPIYHSRWNPPNESFEDDFSKSPPVSSDSCSPYVNAHGT